MLRCAGNGANAVKQALAAYGTNCTCGQVSPGGAIETQTGELAGAVKAGLNVRFDDYGGGLNYGADMPPDTNIAQGVRTTMETTSGLTVSVGASTRELLLHP